MRLKALEIQGFKSFPEKIKLTFTNGITAVVGPNGSGKSNISDAVRWVLGEQSIKTLRGSKMEDVIFDGTQSRNPQGFAYVALTIDNSDNTIAMDAKEVVVSRKLYRSGDSEYRINGTLCRLKDVYELFMDTGLGRDGYSIIGQGKIAEIVSAKSSQRREIFEEAAGISKFRYRKEEAERKLAAADENVIRLKDIFSELEARIAPLERQAMQAQKFLKFSNEKKEKEITLWVDQLGVFRQQMRENADKMSYCSAEYQRIEDQLSTLEQKIQSIFAQMQKAAVTTEEKRNEIKLLEEMISQSESSIAVWQNDILHNENNIKRVQEEIGVYNTGTVESEEQIAQKKEEQVQKQQIFAQKKESHIALQTAIETLKKQQETQEQEIQINTAKKNALQESITQINVSNAASQSLMVETAKRVEQLSTTFSQNDAAIEQIKAELEDCEILLAQLQENKESLLNSQKGHLLKLKVKQEQLEEKTRQKNQITEQKNAKLQRANLLTDMEKNMEGLGSSVKYILNQVKRGILSGVHGPVLQLISVPERYTTAIEIALGYAMQNIVVDNEQIAKRAIEMLKNAKAGRATFLPITAVKGNKIAEKDLQNQNGFVGIAADLVTYASKYQGIMNSLLGRTVIVEDMDYGITIGRKYANRFRIVTLDGQVFNTGGSMTGGYVAKSAGILNRQNEIKKLQQEASSLSDKENVLLEEMKEINQTITGIQAQISGIDGEIKVIDEDTIRCTAQQHNLKETQKKAIEQKNLTEQEHKKLLERLNGLKNMNLSADKQMETITAEEKATEELLNQLLQQKEKQAQQLQQYSEQYHQSQLQLMMLEKDLDAIAAVIVQFTEQQKDNSDKIMLLNEQITQYQESTAVIRENIANTTRQKQYTAQKVARLNEEIEQFVQERLKSEERLTTVRQEEREVSTEREKVSREVAKFEERKITLQTEYDKIVAKLWDEYELTVQEATAKAVPIEDKAALQRQLNELKSKIKALGTVNLSAIEEYKEVSERYTFMREQISDIEASRNELRSLIAKLTTDMKNIFLQSFEEINQQFSAIFTELFGGGRASLTLSDQENVLESGIEIYVQPPGKIIKNLSLLSGGEQAFVAIAIYFAILKVRPAPFCLLDEIEAALDDVNVEKFAKYLRRMCDKTQFIAITHRRGTMEEADVLYGVTMQEEGVSKLLELKVSEVEGKLGIHAASIR